jgi:DNA-binding NarL/FixJ family response regulator
VSTEREGKIRVLIVDNGSMQSQLLADALKNDPKLDCAAAANSEDLLEQAARKNRDVALIGSYLEGQPMRGVELVRALRAAHPETRAVLLVESSKRELIVEAFRAGARGIFSRHASLDQLRTCVHQVHQGQIWANAEEMGFAVEALESTPKVKAVDAEGADLLSKRELDVVQLLMEGLTNREIGARLKLSPHTVKNYLFKIFDKLGVSNRMELLTLTVARPQLAKKVAQSTAPKGTESAVQDFAACKRAAERGNYGAQLNLAELCWQGQGMKQDSLAAYTWYLIAEMNHLQMKPQIQAAMRRVVETLSTDDVLEAKKRASEQFARIAHTRQGMGVGA